ncbi:DUF6879 family protein [Micromonospora sp. GCM10011542]|uniref:DUF6879 family protein n=1 Tax=Micromonospora sp. GCM10011542 TaxID=3317337 RepID=UPI00362211E7
MGGLRGSVLADHRSGFWKLERQQTFKEPGDAGWQAFADGRWEDSLRILDGRRPEFEGYYRRIADNGFATRRVQQLPGDVRGFVNRVEELRALNRLLTDGHRSADVTLSVITGTAGVGKTSLALRWAHSVRNRFPDGQLYANLRGYDPGPPAQPEQILDRFLRALGVPPAAVPADLDDRAALYRSRLAGRRVLVVLDNAATARQVRPLLPGTDRCLVVVTSRNMLSRLATRDGGRRLTLRMLSEQDAVTLLRDITSAYRSGDDPDELTELARLCARLPLALRFAAERAASRPFMPLGQLIQDLRDESALWDRSPRRRTRSPTQYARSSPGPTGP